MEGISKHIMNLIKYYKDVLSLSQEKVMIKKGTICYDAELEWDEDNSLWIINYNEGIDDYYFVHELGHIYLAKKANFEDFAKPYKDTPDLDGNFEPLFNGMLDGLVDFRLSQFEEIYPILRKMYLKYLDDLDNTFSYIVENADYIQLLSWYILWFQALQFILTTSDRKRNIKKIGRLLDFAEHNLLKFKGGIAQEDFKEAKVKLNAFDSIKGSLNPKDILLHFANVLYTSNLWDKKKILSQVILYFPGIKELL